jgi:hypothetical protein
VVLIIINLQIIKIMTINLEIDGVSYFPDNDEKSIHGVFIGDIGLAWSDKTDNLKIVRYADNPTEKRQTIDKLKILPNEEIKKELIINNKGQTLTTDIIIRNK